ncbi:MAG: hypothetical protein VB099_17135, partial [Candidatus Limiplasma sp.]|nr:hypothetical protein [Candidatus Limiplasma sp.]
FLSKENAGPGALKFVLGEKNGYGIIIHFFRAFWGRRWNSHRRPREPLFLFRFAVWGAAQR